MSVVRPKPPEDPIHYDPAAVFAAGAALLISRWVFQTALSKYRSASS
jgi:hypothetical protein